MCGIFGLLKKSGHFENQIESEILRKSISHRGPNGSGVHQFENGFAGNVRLAIVDRAGGHQPIYTSDRKMGIVYNGEIYNHDELREELQKKGFSFQTKSDTEVVLQLYKDQGVESFKRFNGMFAFCIWDETKKVTYIVRDHIGIKPLYVYEDENQIVFSSEIKSLLSVPGLKLELDPLGIQDYLLYRYIPAPHTLYKRIRKLNPGCYLEIRNGQATQWNYWDTSYSEKYPFPSFETAKEQLNEILTKAVKSQLMGEVPVGVLLSGGLDSSAIAYYVHKAGANLKTFNIGFPEVNEFKYSRQVAQKFGLQHYEIETTVDELLKNYDKVSLALDEPIADPACLPLYQLCEELKKHVVVVLSGEGGDELFGGYNQYRDLLSSTKIPYGEEYSQFIQRSWYFTDHKDLLKDRTYPQSHLRFRKYFEENSLLNGMLNFDMKTWMPDNLMMKADKILMSHSLEGRFPFLDIELFQFMSQMPEEYKIDQDKTKLILRDLITPVLPRDVIERPKMGFTVPVNLLVMRLKNQILESTKACAKTEMAEIIDMDKVEKYLDSYYKNPTSGNHLKVWTLFTLFYWYSKTIPDYVTSRGSQQEMAPAQVI